MMVSDQVLAALIGAISALLLVVIKDIVFRRYLDRKVNQRSLLQARIEHAYAPLEFLAYRYLRTDDVAVQHQIATEIGEILRHRAHLLSEPTTSAFYALLEDVHTGALLLHRYFFTEYLVLKAKYYHSWDAQQDVLPVWSVMYCVDPANLSNRRLFDAVTSDEEEFHDTSDWFGRPHTPVDSNIR